jgi:hypothetical protein
MQHAQLWRIKKFLAKWVTPAPKTDLVVRYEDLLIDPVSWLRRAIEQFGASAHGVDHRLSAIVATVSRSDEGENLYPGLVSYRDVTKFPFLTEELNADLQLMTEEQH